MFRCVRSNEHEPKSNQTKALIMHIVFPCFSLYFAAVGIFIGRFVCTANGKRFEGISGEWTNQIVQIRYNNNGPGRFSLFPFGPTWTHQAHSHTQVSHVVRHYTRMLRRKSYIWLSVWRGCLRIHRITSYGNEQWNNAGRQRWSSLANAIGSTCEYVLRFGAFGVCAR